MKKKFHKNEKNITKWAYNWHYKAVTAGDDGIATVEDLWDSWEKTGIERIDVREVLEDKGFNLDSGLFAEIQEIARELSPQHKNIELYPIRINNFFECRAELIGDMRVIRICPELTRFFFDIICTCFFLIDVAETSHEVKEIEEFIKSRIMDGYIERTKESHLFDDFTKSIAKKCFKTSYYAADYFKTIKIFLIAHEVGHFNLGHNIETKGDSINLEDEFEADKYGFEIFYRLLHGNYYYSAVRYRDDYGPIFALRVYKTLDEMKNRLNEGSKKISKTHPEWECRINRLISEFNISPDPFGNQLVRVWQYLTDKIFDQNLSHEKLNII